MVQGSRGYGGIRLGLPEVGFAWKYEQCAMSDDV